MQKYYVTFHLTKYDYITPKAATDRPTNSIELSHKLHHLKLIGEQAISINRYNLKVHSE